MRTQRPRLCPGGHPQPGGPGQRRRASRRQPGGGAFGPDTCKAGFVWREACGPQDHICVSGATRSQAAVDNAQASSRFLSPPVLWDVLTQHNDPARTGAQLHETILNPFNVRAATFGKLYERSVDGQVISQPLYESNQSLPGKGLKNIVYVATRKNLIYAFDADDLDTDPSHGIIWKTSMPVEPAGRPDPGRAGARKAHRGTGGTASRLTAGGRLGPARGPPPAARRGPRARIAAGRAPA